MSGFGMGAHVANAATKWHSKGSRNHCKLPTKLTISKRQM
jgi:hypothetical protein